MAKMFFSVSLILGLMFFWRLNTPEALSVGVCNCMGDVSVNFIGKTVAGAANVDLAGLCKSNGGKFDGSTCSGLLRQLPASSKGECEGYSLDTLIRKFDLPSTISTAGSVTIYCIWEESGDLSPEKNATGPAVGEAGGQAAAAPSALSGTCPKDAVCLENPLNSNVTSMLDVYGTILKTVLGIIGSLTLLMFVWGGFQWVTSAGNAEKVKKGSQTMIWAAIGVFLVLSSYLIMTTFLDYLVGAPK